MAGRALTARAAPVLGHAGPFADAVVLLTLLCLVLGVVALLARNRQGTPVVTRLLFGGSILGTAILLPILHSGSLFRITPMTGTSLALRLDRPILETVTLLDDDQDERARVLDGFLRRLQTVFAGTDAGGTEYSMRGMPPYRSLDATAERPSWSSAWTASLQVITPDGWQPADRRVSFLASFIYGPARAEPVGDGQDAARRIAGRLREVLDALAADPDFVGHLRR